MSSETTDDGEEDSVDAKPTSNINTRGHLLGLSIVAGVNGGLGYLAALFYNAVLGGRKVAPGLDPGQFALVMAGGAFVALLLFWGVSPSSGGVAT